MKKLDEIMKNEYVRDIGIIGATGILDYVAGNMLDRNIQQDKGKVAKIALSLGSAALSFYIGKSIGEKGTENERP